MPSFDPNAEVNSLSFTIPFWVDSMDKVLHSKNTTLATKEAKDSLKLKLKTLSESIVHLYRTLED